MKNRCSAKGKAFSLVEILVALTIILILASLTFVVVGSAKRRAQSSSCASQVRQVVMAALQYSVDADGQYPQFLGQLKTRGTEPVFFCPADRYRDQGGHWTMWTRSMGLTPVDETSYGYTFGVWGQLEYETNRTDQTQADEFPVLVVCLAHQSDPSPYGLAAGLDGTVVRGMRDGSVQLKRMPTKSGVSSNLLFGK